MMISDQIEKIKEEYTDKYVVVDSARPELARFREHVGQVKTVNMSGRALVEFIDFHLNIGWHDIDLDFLKVVDKPLPKEKKPAAKKPAAKKPAAKADAPAGEKKKLSPLEMARAADGGGTAKSTEKKMSPLEAARAADGGGAAKPAAKPAGKKMSVAEMLAAARAETSGEAAPAAEEAPAEPEPAPEAEPAAEPVAEAPAEESAEGGVVKVDRSSMSVADMIAYCREKDAE